MEIRREKIKPRFPFKTLHRHREMPDRSFAIESLRNDANEDPSGST